MATNPPKEYYCPEHKYNPPPNSGLCFCPYCESPFVGIGFAPILPALNLTADNLLALLLASERSDLLWIWEQRASNVTRCWACNAERPDNEDDCPNCGVSAVPF